MTTIVTVPYKDGIALVSDTRATDTSSFQRYHCRKQNGPVCKLNNGLEIFIGLAGASIGAEAMIHPFIKTLERTLQNYCIDINLLEKMEFTSLMNNISMRHYLKHSSEFAEVPSQFLFIFKTKKLLFALNGGILGFCTPNNLNSVNVAELDHESNFTQTGSGGRYAMGAILLENKINPWIKKSQEEVVDWFKSYFGKVIAPDIASSIIPSFHITLVTPKKNQFFEIKC